MTEATGGAVERLYGEAELARFYDMRGTDRDDFAFCRRLAQDATSILDLGCGTGALAAELAADRMVVGIDPASAMLDIARARPGGDRVRWLVGDARSVRLDQRFDLIVMTGHSFQVFLDDKDQSAVFQTIAAHLQPAGRFVFDSRNPDFPGRKTRSRDETLHLDEHP
ncbi:class I SAM-dependent methyltransferase [Nitratireductor sp. ZSWI3]|uniref:class I SAM-dependent DNA methyltransferase n=1 Tax=Nitratireductor sp. ZSWI3 TaxID=2966359 RepID=UPI0027E35293|nr:class I SAM-dependent methyltransferase [Nitratireductor sp. ZSWI3]